MSRTQTEPGMGPPEERDEKRWYMDADVKSDFEIMKTRLEKILGRTLTQSEFVALLNSRETQILRLFTVSTWKRKHDCASCGEPVVVVKIDDGYVITCGCGSFYRPLELDPAGNPQLWMEVPVHG